MLRVACAAIQTVAARASCVTRFVNGALPTRLIETGGQLRTFTALARPLERFGPSKKNPKQLNNLNGLPAALTPALLTSVRTVTKFSLTKGKRKSVKAVIHRFMRLGWGAWIRPRVGRHNTLWRESQSNRRRLRQHVFCNGQQSHLFDKMVTKYWRRPRFYAEDPYEPYHTRDEFILTRKKPRPFPYTRS